MTTPNNLPAELASYLTARDHDRSVQVQRTLDTLMPREQAIAREAAVMGYVLGAIAAGGILSAEIPPDKAILWEVVGACLGRPDLYPTLAEGGNR